MTGDGMIFNIEYIGDFWSTADANDFKYINGYLIKVSDSGIEAYAVDKVNKQLVLVASAPIAPGVGRYTRLSFDGTYYHIVADEFIVSYTFDTEFHLICTVSSPNPEGKPFEWKKFEAIYADGNYVWASGQVLYHGSSFFDYVAIYSFDGIAYTLLSTWHQGPYPNHYIGRYMDGDGDYVYVAGWGNNYTELMILVALKYEDNSIVCKGYIGTPGQPMGGLHVQCKNGYIYCSQWNFNFALLVYSFNGASFNLIAYTDVSGSSYLNAGLYVTNDNYIFVTTTDFIDVFNFDGINLNYIYTFYLSSQLSVIGFDDDMTTGGMIVFSNGETYYCYLLTPGQIEAYVNYKSETCPWLLFFAVLGVIVISEYIIYKKVKK